jgi:flagellar biosynthesis protein FlhF
MGGGKTSVTAKLAYQLGLEKGISPLVLSLDNIKIGASDQLGRLCRLMGVAFHSIENPGELRIVLEENEHRRLILIDTPGLHAGDPYLAADLAACLADTVPVERHLVIPASARSTSMETWLDQAEALSIGYLLFTRLDETELFGPMWSLAAARKIPLSWMSLGPRIPEDLEPANVSRLCSTIAGSLSFPSPSPALPRANAARAGSSHF